MSMMTTVRVGPDSVGWRQWGGVTGYSYIRGPHVFFWIGAHLGVNPALIRVSYDQKSKGLFLLEHHVGLGLHVYAHRSPCHRLMALNVATRVDAGESCRCQGDGRVAWLEVRLRHFCYSDSGLSHSTLARLPVITVNSACRRRCLATTPRRCYAVNVRHHRTPLDTASTGCPKNRFLCIRYSYACHLCSMMGKILFSECCILKIKR